MVEIPVRSLEKRKSGLGNMLSELLWVSEADG